MNTSEQDTAGFGDGPPRIGELLLYSRATPYRRSYVNDAVEVLRVVGHSMKLQELQSTISRRRGKSVSLGSLKVCLSRYVDPRDSSKLLRRVAPGLFALTEWHEGRSAREDMIESHSLQEHLPLFVWTLPPDGSLGTEEQRVYLRAENEDDVLARLEYAGVPDFGKGLIQLCNLHSRRQAASS